MSVIPILRNYSDMIELPTFLERLRYLKLRGGVAQETFGADRYINQAFYASYEWKEARRNAIARDLGCDLAIADYPILYGLLVHHMNPVTIDQIKERDPSILDVEYLITTTQNTHNAIHYADERSYSLGIEERKPGDTSLW